MEETTYYYFAYGSNNLEQLAYRVGRKSGFKHELGVMKDNALIFAGYSRLWDGGIASFQHVRGAELHGTVVELTAKEFEELDAYENGYKRVYRRIHVTGMPDSVIHAYVYLKENHAFCCMPSTRYMNAIYKNIRKKKIDIHIVSSDNKTLQRVGVWRFNKGIEEHKDK